jgi:hypothetical protein
MAATRRSREDDVISRLADGIEDALRRLVDAPRRVVGDVRDGADTLLYDLARKLRVVDQLDVRVTELERRLNSLEKPAKQPARRATPRAKPVASGQARPTTATKPEQAEHDRGPVDTAIPKSAEEDPATGTAVELQLRST